MRIIVWGSIEWQKNKQKAIFSVRKRKYFNMDGDYDGILLQLLDNKIKTVLLWDIAILFPFLMASLQITVCFDRRDLIERI